MKRLLAALAILFSATAAHATAYTSNTANCGSGCNWNVGSSWTGGSGSDFPDDTGDTATISAGDEVTIPVGLTVGVGTITVTAGTNTTTNRTKIINNGTWNYGASLSWPTISTHQMGPNAVLDLRGFDDTAATDHFRIFTGTVGNRAIVQSTGGRGALLLTGSPTVIATWDYVHVSGLGDSVFARENNTASMSHYEHCVFIDMESFLVANNGNAAAGIQFNYNDIRNPHTPSGTDYQPQIIMTNQSLGANVREMIGNTWSNSTATVGRIFAQNALSITFTDNVIQGFQIENGAPFINLARNMLYYDNGPGGMGNQWLANTTGWTATVDSYFYYDGNAHPFGSYAGTSDFSDSVFEATGTAADWLSMTTNAQTHSFVNNIFIGAGRPIAYGAPGAAPTITLDRNTFYMNQNSLADPAAILVETGATLAGTVSVTNNLFVDQNTTAGAESAIYVSNTTANQIDISNYNGHAGYNSSGAYAATLFSYKENNGAADIAGLGANDLQADPMFVDRTRKLASWDASLGGPGTAAHAIAEMYKQNGYGGAWNAAYNVTDLLTWVRDGFKFQNAAYDNAGQGGVDIGAMPYQAAVAFTSNTANCAAGCNWNNGASWTGGSGSNYPSASADTAVISAGDEVTIPAGLTVRIGTTTVTAGTNTTSNRTKIINAGTWHLGAALSLPTISSLEMGANAVLDLNGFTVTAAATDVKYIFTGTAGNRWTLRSTGSRGSFAITGTSVVNANWIYGNVSGLADSSFARSQTSAFTPSYEYIWFDDMEFYAAELTSTNVNAGFKFNHNKNTNPHAPTGTDSQPSITMAAQALGTAPREIKFSVWDGGARLGRLTLTNVVGAVLEDSVLSRYTISATGGTGLSPLRCVFYNALADNENFFIAGANIPAITDTYFYYEGGNHVFGFQTTGPTVTGSVHEAPTSLGMNWYLASTSAITLSVSSSIFLGTGTPLSITGSNAGSYTWDRNTSYMSNDTVVDFAIGVETEQTANLTGTFNYTNNLDVDSDTTTGTEAAISLITAAGTQIDSANGNGHAGYNSGGTYVPTTVGYWHTRGAGQIAGLGANDVFADPLFVDKARKLATWDASLGGPGTATHANAELLKLNDDSGYNAAYNAADLVTWVRNGFKFQNSAYDNTGLAGVDIGAMPYQAPPASGGVLLLGAP